MRRSGDDGGGRGATPTLRAGAVVLLAFAISWAMHIPLALATLRSGDATASTGSPLNLLYNSTEGSLLLVWLFHTASTITGYLLGELPTVTDELVGVAAAVVVVLAAGPTQLSRSRPRQRLSATRPHNLIHGPPSGGEPLCAGPGPVTPSRDAVRLGDQGNGASWP